MGGGAVCNTIGIKTCLRACRWYPLDARGGQLAADRLSLKVRCAPAATPVKVQT